MKFVARDLETANEDYASICQIGIVVFEDGSVSHKYTTLINPEDSFSRRNIRIHGILPEHVADAPTLPVAINEFIHLLRGELVVTHTPFDRASIRCAFEKYRIDHFECRWLDSARVVRRVWLDRAAKGFGLAEISSHLGIEFRHHDACEDARAAGEILLLAVKASSVSVEDWLIRSRELIGGSSGGIPHDGNADGPLYGTVMVFTGSLQILRRDAARMASEIGCKVADTVTKETTMLVVGDQDLRMLNGKDKSSKHRKAEALIESGQEIRIVGESDFLALCNIKG